MKPDNWNRFAAGLLAILLCLCSFSMPAFASGTDPAPEPLPEIIEEEPTTGGMEPEGVPITPKGNATLVDDFYGDKQLITVTTKAGNYFYILIDRANEDKETSVHFLNQVDDADLLALLDEEPQETEVCTCTVKCEAGDVNENCPLCEKSLRNCTAPEAVKTDTETPQEKPKSNMGSLMILLVLALAGGGAGLYYFKFRKSKADTTGHDDLDEYDFGEDEDPADFKGHSLSVSDVVVLHQNGQDTAHYCDSVGFQQVPEFLRENPLRTAELSIEQNENMIDEQCTLFGRIGGQSKGRRTNFSDGPCRRSQGRRKGAESKRIPNGQTEKAVHPGTVGCRKKGTEQANAATEKDKGIGGLTMNFSVEEENLICMYHTSDRCRTMARMRAALPDMDTEMRRLANGTIAKLEHMTDADFDGQRFDFTNST